MRPAGKLIALGLLIAVAGGQDVGSSSQAESPVGEARNPARFTFRVETPPVVETARPEGKVTIEIEGFGTPERRPGAPDLPTKTVLIAIPPGVEPRLEVRAGVESVRPGVRLQPVPRRRYDVSGEDDLRPGRRLEGSRSASKVRRHVEYREDASLFAAGEPFPRERAWLGEIGVLRDQRYVEVHLAPVRYDPAASGLRIAPWLEVEVVFEGGAISTTPAPVDARFESVYRRAFLNYTQGRRFRISEVGPQASELARSSTGAGTDDPSARRRLVVRESGVVRLDYARMSSTGFITEPLSTWKLSNRGVEVPIHVMDDDGDGVPEGTDGNDLLDPGEWVQFYGQALDDEPETVLNADVPGPNDIYEARDFSDDNPYFLTIESGARSRMTEREATPPPTPTPPATFDAVAHEEVDDAWRPLAAADPWYWGTTLAGPESRTDDVPLPGLAPGTQTVRVMVHLQGRSSSDAVFPDHATQITLKSSTNQVLETNNDDGTFDGIMLYLHDFNHTGSQLSDPVRVELNALAPGAAPRNDVILDWIEIHYPRLFQVSGDALVFTWPDGDEDFSIGGLSNDAPAVYEITGRVGVSNVVDAVRLTGVEVTGSGPYTVRFRMDNDPGLPDGTDRMFVVTGDAGVTVPTTPDFTVDTVSDLGNTAIQADLIVIAHPDVLDDPANCASTKLTSLLAHRGTQGITSRVACIEDVQDEFNDGLAGPLAIKNFLAWVMSPSGWTSPKPSYVLLLGDGSFDYKGGTAQGSYVPTQILFQDSPILGYYASDSLMAAVVGTDRLADLAVGRIPARTVADANLVLQKILDYEQTAPGAAWQRHALTVADRGKRTGADGAVNAAESLGFEDTNADSVSFMKTPPHTNKQLRYWSDFCDTMAAPPEPCDAGGMRIAIKDGVNGDDEFDRAALVQFTGHGNAEVWSDDAFFDERDPPSLRDTLGLFNGGELPWMMAHNCLTGSFHTTLDHSMGEDWLLRDDGTGGSGAIAVWSPSGLSFSFIGDTVGDIVWEDLFGPRKERSVAVPVMDVLATLCVGPSPESCQNYVFLGDPSMTLALPTVDPPTNVQATPSNMQVDLSWSGTAASYDVYRTINLQHAYTKVGSTGTTSYTDTDVVNATTYYYSIVALDAEGFESRWSNFNTDCDVSGPDCVEAEPLNPDPPAPPTGVTVVDSESGGRLDVSWNGNTEVDFEFYEVHHSTEAGCFTNPQCTPVTNGSGRATSYAILGLEDGTEYFVVVTATNTSGNRSDPSTEQSEIPHFVRGIRAPGFIGDLRLDKSGAHAVLSWSAVTLDIFDKTETVLRYEVYRGESPQFVPTAAHKIGETAGTGFQDDNALDPGMPDYHYLVRAVDTELNGGGLGAQLPDGIGDLRVDYGVTGSCSVTTSQSCQNDGECPALESCVTVPDTTRVVLSWSPVSIDFDGRPTSIDHYEVYEADQPFGRAEICDALDPGCTAMTPAHSVTATSLEIPTPAPNRYYSVLAVDGKGNKSPF